MMPVYVKIKDKEHFDRKFVDPKHFSQVYMDHCYKYVGKSGYITGEPYIAEIDDAGRKRVHYLINVQGIRDSVGLTDEDFIKE